jgi:hypothetical protein
VDPVARIDRIVDQAGQEIGASDVVLTRLPITSYESYTDVGRLDTSVATRSWGDGTPIENLGTVLGATTGAHTYSGPGLYQLQVTMTDDDTGAGAAARAVQVVTPTGAISRAIDDLSRATSNNPTAAAAINAALANLRGNNGGRAHNGALDKLNQGALEAALEMIGRAIGNLEAAEQADSTLNFTRLKSLLTLAAKSVVVEAIIRAEASASSVWQRRQVAAARDLLSQGQSLLDSHNYTGAIDKFRDALSKTQFA